MLTSAEARFRTALLEWGTDNVREFPWREPTRSLYEVFVAEFFLTQTPADNVASVYPEFLDRFPSLESLDEASEEALIDVLEPLGFYNMRAEALQEIASQYDALPESVDELVEMPRVGRYIANATLCFGRGRPVGIVDRNVDRVYRRVFEETWPDSETDRLAFADRLVPADAPRAYNYALLDFGAAICGPTPRCDVCFARDYCSYFRDE